MTSIQTVEEMYRETPSRTYNTICYIIRNKLIINYLFIDINNFTLYKKRHGFIFYLIEMVGLHITSALASIQVLDSLYFLPSDTP